MPRFPQPLVLSAVACALLIAVGLVAWGPATDSSQAQAGTMHNCPPAGKWSIAVWDGEGGTMAGDALATCGADAVAAAYSLDPQTGAWSRWFAGKPDVSNLPPLNDMQGVLALGGATVPATPMPSATPAVTATAAPTATPTASAEGPELGTYTGTTSQGKPIELDVVEGGYAAGNRAIGRIRFEYEGACGTACTCHGDVETVYSIAPLAIVDGAFSKSVQEYDISGEFSSATTASGDLEYHHTGTGPSDPDCNSGPVTWTASLQ
jgi:hypothetical protein